jgi:hypothetical protein
MSPSTSASVCSPLPSSGSRVPPVPHLPRYYGVVRLLQPVPAVSGLPRRRGTSPLGCGVCSPGRRIHASRGRAPLRSGGAHACLVREEAGGLPGSWRIPVKACPGLGTPAAPNDLAFAVVRMLSSARLTASTSATVNDFGAAPSRPASSLPTLLPRQSPGERQGSLPACPLRRWPGWILTSWIPSRGFGQPTRRPPLPDLAWRDSYFPAQK